ncbi:MAG: von Willebrand factor type A domain-containing protein [Gemmataceae bacterium]|nr:von Willebrand factor type A domain-containing protein [Gemmataceae bacterium]
MTPDIFETKLTAYALNDPSLTDAERAEIEARLRTDPAARQALEETRQVGHLLLKSLAAEAQAVEAKLPATVASTLAKPKPSSFNRFAITIASLAAVVMLAVFVGRPMWERNSPNGGYAAKAAPVDGDAFGDGRVLAKKSSGRELSLNRGSANALLVEVVDEKLTSDLAPSVGSGGAQPFPQQPFGGTGFGGGTGAGMQKGAGFGGGGFGGGGYLPPGAGVGAPSGSTTATPPADYSKLPASNPTMPSPVAAPVVATDEAPAVALPKGREISEQESAAKGDGYHASGNNYRQLVENAFTRVQGQDALSTFGVDVDTASYSIVRNYLNRNAIPHPDAVRLEEMINYFPYRDAPPDGNDPFTVRVEMAECPWKPTHRLARVALKAKPIDNAKRPPSNLVFLVDVSGSMNEPNKLPLVKEAMKLLVSQLGENDRVAIVVYAGASGLVLDSTNASKKDVIINSLDSLAAGGSTNGGAGIQLAYDVAIKNFIEKGTNRVILCTDGDWNVGTTGTDGLVKLIEDKKKSGVFLSVFGFGMGNLRDEMMVQLAGKGNGNYGYIDTIAEAKKALVEQISGTLVTVAKDVKIQIEFNPVKIAAYRLIGYEKRKLAAKDFHNDKKDAGEMGAGHVVTALYELVPVGAAVTSEEKKNEGLRYQANPKVVEQPKGDVDAKVASEAFVVKLRHKLPDADKSTLREIPVGDVAKSYDKASEDFQFASAVAAFGMLLKQSPYKGQASYALVEELAQSAMTHDPGQYRAEFLSLVRKAKALTGQK